MIDVQSIAIVGLTFTTAWSFMELRKKSDADEVRTWLDGDKANNDQHHENLRKYAETLVGDHKACSGCGQVYDKRQMQEVEHWIEDPYERRYPYGSISILRLERLATPTRHREGNRTEWFCTKHKKPFTIQLRTMGHYAYRFTADGSLDTGPKPRYFNRVPLQRNPGWEEYIPKEPRK